MVIKYNGIAELTLVYADATKGWVLVNQFFRLQSEVQAAFYKQQQVEQLQLVVILKFILLQVLELFVFLVQVMLQDQIQ